MRHAFDVAGIDTVTASYFTANPASGAVLRKNGFEDKGDCTVYCRARAENVAGTLMQLAREKAAW
jgi:RimJ/RimL family protein N-acetyltransferase